MNKTEPSLKGATIRHMARIDAIDSKTYSEVNARIKQIGSGVCHEPRKKQMTSALVIVDAEEAERRGLGAQQRDVHGQAVRHAERLRGRRRRLVSRGGCNRRGGAEQRLLGRRGRERRQHLLKELLLLWPLRDGDRRRRRRERERLALVRDDRVKDKGAVGRRHERVAGREVDQGARLRLELQPATERD